MSAVKKTNPIIETLSSIPNFKDLYLRERALIYAMLWCNSDKSNRNSYPFSSLMELSEEIYKFINK